MASRPTIAVVIVNWNSRDDVLAGLRSLHEQTDPDVQVVVVDNGSKDGSAGAIRAAFPDVLVVETGENLGFAEGCNRGIEASRSDWVFLLNNDAEAEPTCVAELRRVAAAAPGDVGMLQPLLVFTTRPSHVNSSGVLLYRNGYGGDRHFMEPIEAAVAAGDPFCATAGAALYRRSMLERVRLPGGCLDREFFMYFEDVDLGWRCRLAGYRAVYVPSARVRHRFQGSSIRRGEAFVDTHCRINRIATLIHNASVWFILRSAIHTAYGVFAVWRDAGLGPLLGLGKRLPALIRDRRRIGRLARVGRRELERTWCVKLATLPPLDLPDRHD